MPAYFHYINVTCSLLATAAWLARPSLGPWPLLVALAPWAARWWLKDRPGFRTAFDGPMAVFFLTAMVSVAVAYDRETASAKFWLLVGAALLFYAFANWQIDAGRSAYKGQAWLLSGLGATTAAYFLVTNDWATLPEKVPVIKSLGLALQGTLPAFPGEPIHANVIGGVLAMLAPFGGAALMIAWHEGSRWQRATTAAMLGLTLAGLTLTMTRGAWLALLAACVLAIWWPFSGLIAGRQRRRRRLFFGVPLAVAGSVLLVLSLWPGAAETLLQSIPAAEAGGNRAVLYTNVLNLLGDTLFTGAGLGGFMMLYSSYDLLAHVGFITHSHNLVFDVILEQGIVASMALAWMWLLMSRALWRSLAVKRKRGTHRRRRDQGENGRAEDSGQSQQEDRENRLQYWRVMLGASAMSLVVLLVQGLIDDPIYGSRAVVIFFLPLSFGVPVLRLAGASSRRWQVRTVVVGSGLLLVAGLVWWRPLLSRFESNLAAVEQSRQELSVYKWPEWPIQDAVRREIDLSGAIDAYHRALEVDANNSSANRRLGQIELSLGEYDAALGHLQRAYSATPWDNATRELLGEAYITTGDLEQGMALWRNVDDSLHQLDLRRYWYEHIGEDPPLAYIRQALADVG
jgi:O-antigen ligase